jgi:hypothetical protein
MCSYTLVVGTGGLVRFRCAGTERERFSVRDDGAARAEALALRHQRKPGGSADAVRNALGGGT